MFLAAFWFGCPQVMGQDPKAVVVVTDSMDADAFRRIGNRLVDVEVLFGKSSGVSTSEYKRCNDRVRELRDFQLLFYREDAECAADRFWRQRLAAANPQGETLRLPVSRLRSEAEQHAERAKAVHKALLAKFPTERTQLDANLKSELHRLYMLKAPALQIAAFY